MYSIDRISIERECARLIFKYAYLNDERNFEALVDLFTEDAVLYRPASQGQAIVGHSAILDAFKSRPVDVATFHVCSDIIIDIEDDSMACGRSRILLLSGTKPPGSGAVPTEAKPPVPGTFQPVSVDGKRLEIHGAT